MVILRFILKTKTLGEIGLAVSRHIFFVESFEDIWLLISLKLNSTEFYRNSRFLQTTDSAGRT